MLELLLIGGGLLLIYVITQNSQPGQDPGAYDKLDVKASRSYRNNNPGNLIFANQDLAVGKDDKGYTQFANAAEKRTFSFTANNR